MFFPEQKLTIKIADINGIQVNLKVSPQVKMMIDVKYLLKK